MYSYSTEKPSVEKYDAQQYRVPFCIEQVTVGEGADAVQQYRARELFVSKNPSLAEKQALIARKLNEDVGAYIYGYYDPGTQQTFQALIAMDDIPEDTKSAIKTIFPWIQACLGYYYTIKANILSSDTPELVTWDFGQFDATKPDVSLAAVVGGL